MGSQMSDDDKEFAKEFLKGLAGGALILGIFGFFVYTLGGGGTEPTPKFKVVDKYNGCDVVRYAPENRGEYTYFLDCK